MILNWIINFKGKLLVKLILEELVVFNFVKLNLIDKNMV